ncbi:hypothetical protein H4Q26_010610 [Puccinia striiformis f. sp. tritici PST-130]|nr:hypothetical protein H4Q26_010610 [Puccinia striiformis f. sp. tritici PST-130]
MNSPTHLISDHHLSTTPHSIKEHQKKIKLPRAADPIRDGIRRVTFQPLDPHNPLASQQSRDAYLTAVVERRSNFLRGRASSYLHPNTTPIGRWLQAVEPMSLRMTQPYGPPHTGVPTANPPPIGLQLLDLEASRESRSQLRVQPPRSQLARGHQPDQPGLPRCRLYSRCRLKQLPQEKARPAPDPHQPQNRSCHPLSKLRQGKPTTRKGKSSQKAVLAPSVLALRPCNQPIFCCPICGFRLPLLTAINQHIRDNHPRAYNPTNGDVNDHEHEPSEK